MAAITEMCTLRVHYRGEFVPDVLGRPKYVGGLEIVHDVEKDRSCIMDLRKDLAELCTMVPDTVELSYFKWHSSASVLNTDKELLEMYNLYAKMREIDIFVDGVTDGSRFEEKGKEVVDNEGDEEIVGHRRTIDGDACILSNEGSSGKVKGPKGKEPTLSDYTSDSGFKSYVHSDSSEEYHDVRSFDPSIDMDRPQIFVNTVFPNATVLRAALRMYCIRENFSLLMVKNEKKRITAECSATNPYDGEKCLFRFHARKQYEGNGFIVKQFDSVHTCQGVNRGSHPLGYTKSVEGNRMASEQWVASVVKPKLQSNMNIPTIVLWSEIQREFGVEISKQKVYRGREIALTELRGSYEEAYKLVPQFASALLETNPGSIVKYKVDDNHCFERLFVSLAGPCRAFEAGLRPMVGLDGCFLKSKYKGCLLAAVAQDGENGLFPLAIAVVEAENRDAWSWFLHYIKEAIRCDIHTFMSDRQKGLIDAVEEVFPEAHHRYCMRHLYKNFNVYFKGIDLRNYFWTASTSTCVVDYHAAMDKLQALNANARIWLDKIDPSTWCRAFFPNGDPYCWSTNNNACESFNAWIKKIRDMPLTNLFDGYRRMWMEAVQNRRIASETVQDCVMPKVRQKLKKMENVARHLSVLYGPRGHAEVGDGNTTHTIDYMNRVCTCRRWQMTGIPCTHGIAALLRQREDPANYVHGYFTTDTYRHVYLLCNIYPMGSTKFWPQLFNVYEVKPPITHRPPGRPKKNRRKHPDEDEVNVRLNIKRPVHCRRCRGAGHNHRTCKQVIGLPTDVGNSSAHIPVSTQDGIFVSGRQPLDASQQSQGDISIGGTNSVCGRRDGRIRDQMAPRR